MNSAFFLLRLRSNSPRTQYVPLVAAMSTLFASPAIAGQNGTTVPAQQGSAAVPAQQGSTPAWQKQPLTLTAANQSLAEVAATLSSRLGCAIVVDGEPALPSADFDLHGSGKEVLSSVALKFDCFWRVNRDGVVLLTRRFTTDTDVPQIHLAEMTQMTADFMRLLPDTGLVIDQTIFPLNALYRTLTPEQRASMQGKKHLNFPQLLPEQQKLVHLAIVNNLFGDGHKRWEHLHDLLSALPRARLVRHLCVWHQIVPRASTPGAPALKEVPGQIVTDEKGSRKDLMVVEVKGEELVCLWQDAQGREQTLLLLRQDSSSDTPILPTNTVSSEDTPDTRAGRTGKRNAATDSITELRESVQSPAQTPALAGINANAPVHLRMGSTTLERLASAIEEQTGVHVLVPRHLRDRQLIVQMDGLSVQAALCALAEINGLRITMFSAKAVGLDRRAVASVEQLSELPSALNGVIPKDFLRFLRVPPTLPQGAQIHFNSYTDAVTRKEINTDWEFYRAVSKLDSAANRQVQSLGETFPMQGATSKTLSYTQMNSLQREYLTQSVTLIELSRVLRRTGLSNKLIYGTMSVGQQDETKTFLTMQGAEILVSTETSENNTYRLQGFGEPIHSPEKLPDPFHFGRQ